MTQVAKRPEETAESAGGKADPEGTDTAGQVDARPRHRTRYQEVGEDANVGHDGENEFWREAAVTPALGGAGGLGRCASAEVGRHAQVNDQEPEKYEPKSQVALHPFSAGRLGGGRASGYDDREA